MTYEEMKSKLLEASDSYYNNSFSIMSDEEFDILKDTFTELYPNDPFLKTIGAPVPENSMWMKVQHKIPMASANKVIDEDELMNWVRSNKLSDEYLMTSEKLDGISVAIDYEDGEIQRAVTRGDGVWGEAITLNVIRMSNVLKNLPISYNGSLRGEIILRRDNFNTINWICEKRKEKPFKNVRNAASGIARRFDGIFTEYLEVLYYYASVDENGGTFYDKSKKEMFEFIENKLDLKTCPHYFGNIETVKLAYNEYEQSKRTQLDYDIDGLIVEVDNQKVMSKLGLLNENPRGMVAYKFKSQKVRTTIKKVHWQLGLNGRMTPVVEVEPVNVAGVTVSRATMHNYENFIKMKPYKGAVCIISRAGDVIPFLERIF
jgi:DNA ligase (NAD+)